MRLARIPHRPRGLEPHRPTHVVLTVRPGLPPLHAPHIRYLFGHVQRVVVQRFPRVSFSAACLMPDHVHLLVQSRVSGSDVARAMQFLAANMARGINHICQRRGTVFRDRYFSRVLNTVSELAGVLRYIANNPVRAKLCKRVGEWFSSSIDACLRSARAQKRWSFPGWMYRVLGFHEDPGAALRRIVDGAVLPVRASGRQNRLPFSRGLPARSVTRSHSPGMP
jgi:REP element-mobilizing transposase RayT